jgi:RNA polymerase sigma-70 factor (ECF subfamily)
MDTPDTRSTLLVRLSAPRDEEAWAEFTAIYAPLVRRVARQRGMQAADADDLVQEVFRAVTRAMEREAFDHRRGSFRGWLFRIARNLIVNFLASQKRQPRGSGHSDVQRLLEAQPSRDEETTLFDVEYRRSLLYWAAERVRGEFSELTWRAFWQTGVEGLPAKDVAHALGTTVGTVYHYKSRVMARLLQEIEAVQGRDEG